MKNWTKTLGTLALAGTAAIAMGGAGLPADDVRLTGAGSTFAQPLFERWAGEYQKKNANVKIEYSGGGSGAGIKSITDKTVSFAASDAPMSTRELEAAGGKDAVVELPICTGAVVPAYNLPGVTEELKFTGELLCEIFSGKVAKWSDAKIAAVNPGVKLPDTAITPAWRTDGSGTTFVFSNYLCTQSESFKSSVGSGKQIKWPVGQGGKGNPGVAAVIQQTAGSIGYIELNYAEANKIAYGQVKNKDGKFVKASVESVTSAGEAAATTMKGNQLTADIWNQPGEKSYPISAFAYLIVYKDLRNLKSMGDADALVAFTRWAVSDEGQKLAKEMTYAPLSKSVQTKIEETLKTVKFAGK